MLNIYRAKNVLYLHRKIDFNLTLPDPSDIMPDLLGLIGQRRVLRSSCQESSYNL